ncbi:hypothetical protein [Halodesulfovibrio aestuarii]|uniref:Uncharacterized protein n=1 Tax=Halodesulfovibrio aestuarii TaxID=126333 RepID=A0ABV4JQG1_9BACT
MHATHITTTGTKEPSNLPSFNKLRHNAPLSLEVAAIDGRPVIDTCDCCGHPICEGEAHTSNKHGVWCTRCMPRGC